MSFATGPKRSIILFFSRLSVSIDRLGVGLHWGKIDRAASEPVFAGGTQQARSQGFL